MPGLKNQIRIPRIILTLVQWSSKPNDESCPRAVESAPYRGFFGIRGSSYLAAFSLSQYLLWTLAFDFAVHTGHIRPPCSV